MQAAMDTGEQQNVQPGMAYNETAELLLAALAEGVSLTVACARANVSITTGYRYMRNREFKARLSNIRADGLSQAATVLVREVAPSIAYLVRVRDDAMEASSTRVRAATNLVELALKFKDEVDVIPRILALEACVQEAAA